MNLLDIIEAQEKAEAPPKCKGDPNDFKGHDWEPTTTIWPGETWERFTWTCKTCGLIWGRCP